MYRIVKESYNNFKEDFIESNAKEDYRYRIMKPFEILFDLKQWEKERAIESEQFKKVADFLDYIDENINDFPEFKVFLRELEARNVFGRSYLILSEEERKEITKIFQMFLSLTYWY
jgi:hypothetical protein